jgi:RNA polymerase sigma-70 factor (ECF subfamily)
MADGLERGLELIDRREVSEPLDGYRWFHSTRADLMRRLERHGEAADSYRRALALSENTSEQAFL